LETAWIHSHLATLQSTTVPAPGRATREIAPEVRADGPASLDVHACRRSFRLTCTCEQTRALLERIFGALTRPAHAVAGAVRNYVIEGPNLSGQFTITDECTSCQARDVDDLIYQLDKQITLAMQLERGDLFFLHAAAVAVNGRAIAMPAFPGTGKSTLTLALTQRGLDYLSDELAPLDLQARSVEPYSRALCLKTLPPFPCSVPDGTLRVGSRFHVPTTSLGAVARIHALPLGAIVFPHRGNVGPQRFRRLTTASAATCLMAHLLNGLAHDNYGLDAAITLSRAVPCFELDLHDLASAADEIAALGAS
jgi:hypothetical protein